MSISPAQLTVALGAAEHAAETSQPRRVAAAGVTNREAPEAEGTQAEPSSPELSTDLRVDDQRHVYYEVINNRTGDVVCQIPREEIRKMEEGFETAQSSQPNGHALDVKS